MKHLIAPSLLSANFLDLRKEMEMINKSDADWLHLDIMDGVFVPNISFGFPVLNALKPICQKPVDVHLMIVEPQKFIPVDKVARLREMIDRKGLSTMIEVDGGVNLETGKRLVDAGANVLVAGNFVFKSPDPIQTIKDLKAL